MFAFDNGQCESHRTLTVLYRLNNEEVPHHENHHICACCLTPPCPAMLRQRVDAVQCDIDTPMDEDEECYAGANYCLGESGLQDGGDTSGVLNIDETRTRTAT